MYFISIRAHDSFDERYKILFGSPKKELINLNMIKVRKLVCDAEQAPSVLQTDGKTDI